MPIFEYQCQDCGRVFEIFTQRRDPSEAPACPGCGKTRVERLLSSFSATVGGRCSSGALGFG
jgi:putative FmdB family regulatory protein